MCVLVDTARPPAPPPAPLAPSSPPRALRAPPRHPRQHGSHTSHPGLHLAFTARPFVVPVCTARPTRHLAGTAGAFVVPKNAPDPFSSPPAQRSPPHHPRRCRVSPSVILAPPSSRWASPTRLSSPPRPLTPPTSSPPAPPIPPGSPPSPSLAPVAPPCCPRRLPSVTRACHLLLRHLASVAAAAPPASSRPALLSPLGYTRRHGSLPPPSLHHRWRLLSPHCPGRRRSPPFVLLAGTARPRRSSWMAPLDPPHRPRPLSWPPHRLGACPTAVMRPNPRPVRHLLYQVAQRCRLRPVFDSRRVDGDAGEAQVAHNGRRRSEEESEREHEADGAPCAAAPAASLPRCCRAC